MAFPSIISCGESCDVSVNGDAETARFKRKKVWFFFLMISTLCFPKVQYKSYVASKMH